MRIDADEEHCGALCACKYALVIWCFVVLFRKCVFKLKRGKNLVRDLLPEIVCIRLRALQLCVLCAGAFSAVSLGWCVCAMSHSHSASLMAFSRLCDAPPPTEPDRQ